MRLTPLSLTDHRTLDKKHFTLEASGPQIYVTECVEIRDPQCVHVLQEYCLNVELCPMGSTDAAGRGQGPWMGSQEADSGHPRAACKLVTLGAGGLGVEGQVGQWIVEGRGTLRGWTNDQSLDGVRKVL